MGCPHCGLEDVIKAGKLRNKYVTKQGYRCKDCRRCFIERDCFEGMTYPKEIYPNGLYQILTRLRKEYDNPVLYVTENGAAFEDNVKRNGGVQDDDRIAFLRDHMLAAYRAIKEGVRLNGYFVWTITDNLEWAEGYSKRFGLARTDYRTFEAYPEEEFLLVQTGNPE